MNLAELIVVIVVTGIIAGAVFLPVVTGVDFWRDIQFREDQVAQGRLAMERMVREITWSVSATTEGFGSETSGQLLIIPESNSSRYGWYSNTTLLERILFEYDAAGQQLWRHRDTRKSASDPWIRNSDLLATSVPSFGFTYYDLWNNFLPTNPTDVIQIFRIEIRMGIRSPAYGDPSYMELWEMVYPRNFSRQYAHRPG